MYWRRFALVKLRVCSPNVSNTGLVLIGDSANASRADINACVTPSKRRSETGDQSMSAAHDESFPRSRAPLPSPPQDPSIGIPPGHVSVRHPGYDDRRELFQFVAYNQNKDGKRWIDFNFAYIMCMAVTGHKEPGFFTHERAPSAMKVGQQQGALLEGRHHYFHVGDDSAAQPKRYAVIKDMRDYVFSPDHVRDHWRAAIPSSQTEDGQQPEACIISGHHPHAQDAHLLPKTEWQY